MICNPFIGREHQTSLVITAAHYQHLNVNHDLVDVFRFQPSALSHGELSGPEPPARDRTARSSRRRDAGGPGFRPATTRQQHCVSEAVGSQPWPLAAAHACHPRRWSHHCEAAHQTSLAGLVTAEPDG